MPRAQDLLENSTARFDRRRFLQLTGTLAGAVAFSQLRADLAGAAPSLGDNPFQLGVASGDPLPNGVVLWTRLAPQIFEADGGMPQTKVPVGWRLATDADMRNVVRRGKVVALPELAHSVHVELYGLKPGTRLLLPVRLPRRPQPGRAHAHGAPAR